MRTKSKNPACGAFCLISLACGAFCFIKNLACGASFWHKKSSSESFEDAFHSKFLILSAIYEYISGENDSNSNTE
jgi:hypothetical protein